MRRVDVYNNNVLAGVLAELDNGKYSFRYDDEYYRNPAAAEISLSLPKRQQEYISDGIFPFFTNLLPEGGNRRVVCRMFKVDETDFFGLLMAMRGADFIGAIELR